MIFTSWVFIISFKVYILNFVTYPLPLEIDLNVYSQRKLEVFKIDSRADREAGVNASLAPSKLVSIYIDADACPVKQEIYRVAELHALKGTALKVFVVTNSPIAVPRDPLIERMVVGTGMDEADSVTSAIADKDNTTRRGPAVCRAAAEEDCRMSRTSRRSDQRTHRYRHWCARRPCCSATARG